MPFKITNPLTVEQEPQLTKNLTPFIEEIEGTALIGQPSKITIKGYNFNPESEIICNAGILSNIQISPNAIYFDCLSSFPGSYPVEVKNNSLSSNDWNRPSAPILIARNLLNITDGWLDFRSVNSENLGSIISHINQNLATKNFTNSGYSLDATRGLIFNGSGTVNSTNNYIQFNSLEFPLSESKIEMILIIDTFSLNNRLRISIGNPVTNNYVNYGIDSPFNGYLGYVYRFGESTSACQAQLTINNSFPNNNNLIMKIVWDFSYQKLLVYKLNDLINFENDGLKIEFNIDLFKGGYPPPFSYSQGIPLFSFYNSGSLSSVVAIKIS